jgi:hypothetical protein
MRKETTSRVMAAEMPYDEFYDFSSVRPKYFGYILVYAILFYLTTLNDIHHFLICAHLRSFDNFWLAAR